MYLLYAPPEKFNRLPNKTALITDEVLFYNNYAYCAKFFWKKYHLAQGCLDVTPPFMQKQRLERTLDNILFVSTGGFGDVLWTMPFMAEIRKRHPRSRILAATEERSMLIFKGVPYVDMCVKDEFWNLQNLIRTADEVWDFGGVATIQKEYKKLDPVEAIFRWGEIPLPREKRDCRPQLVLTIDEGKQAEAYLKRNGIDIKEDKIITLGLESSTPNRDWPYSYSRKLSELLAKNGYKVIWLGEEKDYSNAYFIGCDCGWDSTIRSKTPPLEITYKCPICDKVSETQKLATPPGILNASGQTTFRQAMAIIGLSDLFIGPNSGLMVIATALNIPTIGLFGSFDPAVRTKFYERFCAIWERYKCAPCAEHWTECPEGHPAPCMKIIRPEKVLNTAREMLKRYPRTLLGKEPIE